VVGKQIEELILYFSTPWLMNHRAGRYKFVINDRKIKLKKRRRI
jgi:hypothetical protein